jgi:hypothetical protein
MPINRVPIAHRGCPLEPEVAEMAVLTMSVNLDRQIAVASTTPRGLIGTSQSLIAAAGTSATAWLSTRSRFGSSVLSYHEFELTMESVDKVNVKSSLSQYLRKQFSETEMHRYKNSIDYEYKAFLMKVGPKIMHEGFYEPYLDLIIKKEGNGMN